MHSSLTFVGLTLIQLVKQVVILLLRLNRLVLHVVSMSTALPNFQNLRLRYEKQLDREFRLQPTTLVCFLFQEIKSSFKHQIGPISSFKNI